MKPSKAKTNNEGEINITPMMDVVFIMLIFFIVSTSFVKEKGIAISRNNGITPPTTDTQTATITLGLDAFSINNQTIALDAIEPSVAQLKATNPQLSVQLLSDKNIRIATLVRAIEQVKEAKINNLTVSTF